MPVAGRDLVVVGASAGGVEALIRFVSELPADLPATVLLGLHLSQEMRSVLPELLARRTSLEVLAAEDGLELRPGRIIVSVPDRHLLVIEDRVVLGIGARENGHRPAHDAMLRSAALLRGPRVVGVVLTGLLDDGSAGLLCVQRYGGRCVVQSPGDAAYPDMPLAALHAVPEAQQAALEDLVGAVVELVCSAPADEPVVPRAQRALDEAELASALGKPVVLPDGGRVGEPSPYACPSCHGVLNDVPDEVLRYRCRTGHAWSAESLLAQHDRQVEEAIWSALRALEERAEMASRLIRRAETGPRSWSTGHYAARRDEALRAADTLRLLLASTLERDVPDQPSA